MKIYLILSPENSFHDALDDLFPPEAEVLRFSDALSAYNDIKLQRNPCVAFISFSRIPINGTNFIELVSKNCPYLVCFVLCENNDSRQAAKDIFSIDENKLLSKDLCPNKIEYIKSVLCQIGLISSLCKSTEEIKEKLRAIEKRTMLWNQISINFS